MQSPTPSAGPTESAIQPRSTSTATTTTTTTTTTVDLAEPSSWIIDFTSVGPLAIGADLEAAKRTMTAFASGTGLGSCPSHSILSFDKTGYPSVFITEKNKGDGLIEQIVLEGTGDSSEYLTTSPRTRTGIGIGATLDQLKSAYPDITYQDDHYALPDGHGNWMNFDVLEGLVKHIVVRPLPVIARELCG
ncbi:hypothetical protein QN355_09660 [Cryobacterium sp. 10S3]|uniref:hypothetical protein n=1 Tax=Cryobacterium sp. 10S3 TaxID=3048582 RepID=UPI002AC95F9A|nr:hypothetical protein [Cryobacterium sp. 10S3]MEB0286815.1 hypothetical protein [Cryobacterium sp. 10S3]WPX14078.1 hypothetical protein RHM57_01525 [Cryobacterium sp. 10S3]